MPIYEYVCEECGKAFEHLAKRISEPKPPCPKCGGKKVQKQLSSFAATSAVPAACKSCPGAEASGGGGHSCGCGCACHHH